MRVNVTQVQIREATPDEYEAVGQLTVAAYSEFAERLSDDWWRHYRGDLAQVAERAARGAILVAIEAGEMAGAVSYYRGRIDASDDESNPLVPAGAAHIRALAVDPRWRGKGIGRRLTEACIERARAEGAPAIGLHTTFLMEVAKRMYEAMGFVQVAEHADWPEGLYWTYVMDLEPDAPA